MKLWLALLVGFFSFAAGEGAVDAGADADKGEDKGVEAGEEDQGDLLSGLDADAGDEDAGEDKGADTAAELAAEKQARAQAEQRAEAHQRELNELRGQQRPAQTPDQRLYEQEQARLADPKVTELERWQIEANRKLRLNTQSSQAALMQAHDIADRTAFRQLEVTKPALFKRYEKRVEEELAKMRKAGGNTTREGIMRYLIGTDAMDGKLTAKKKAAPAGETINRGKLPGARSDVRGKTTMSDREKRAARLQDVQI